MTKPIAFLLVGMACCLSGCVTTEQFDVPQGEEAYDRIPPLRIEGQQEEYIISPRDELTISVFREPELSVTAAPVESGGGLVLPLIGRVQAAGRTTSELAQAIETDLQRSGLRFPRVSVILAETRTQNVTVDGAVVQPGVYDLLGRTTLLQTLAFARGANRTADLDKVAIFRTIDGQRNGALFDVMAIREGRMPDPYIQAGDYVVVGSSATKSFYYDSLSILPAFGLFIPLVN